MLEGVFRKFVLMSVSSLSQFAMSSVDGKGLGFCRALRFSNDPRTLTHVLRYAPMCYNVILLECNGVQR